jgi:hypothetical protein
MPDRATGFVSRQACRISGAVLVVAICEAVSVIVHTVSATGFVRWQARRISGAVRVIAVIEEIAVVVEANGTRIKFFLGPIARI